MIAASLSFHSSRATFIPTAFVCFLIPLLPGPAPGWHLEYIDVKDEILDKTFRFPCDRWLAKNDDDGQIMRELACANNDFLDLNEKTSESGTRKPFSLG